MKDVERSLCVLSRGQRIGRERARAVWYPENGVTTTRGCCIHRPTLRDALKALLSCQSYWVVDAVKQDGGVSQQIRCLLALSADRGPARR